MRVSGGGCDRLMGRTRASKGGGGLLVDTNTASQDAAHTAPRGRHARLVAELTEAVHARDAFIAIAAHELRNPMTPILGYVEHVLSVGGRPESECPRAIIVALERLAGLIGEYIKRATTLLDI